MQVFLPEVLAAGNHRNGYSQKTVTMTDDRVVLRDRNRSAR